MMVSPHVSVIVLTWNGQAYIAGCLESLLAQDYPTFEVVVVDNGSVDGTPDLVAERFPDVCLIRNPHNLGFAAGNNAGLRMATGQILVLVNQDTQAHPGFLRALAHAFQDPEVGLAGCKLLYPDGTIQHAGGFLYGPRAETGHIGRGAPDDGRFDEPSEPEFVTGAAVAISRACLARIGPLDEDFAQAYYEDVDWCFRARAAGFRVGYVPEAVLTHFESATGDRSSHQHKMNLNHGRIRFALKHWPLDRLLTDFGPAEATWVAALSRTTELMAARGAYLKVLVDLPGILAFRKGPDDEAPALVRLLADLRAAALTSLEALVETPAPAAQPSPAVSEAAKQEPSPELAAVQSPSAPGGLRATLRRLWAGLRYLTVLPDLVRHVQQHDELIGRVSSRVQQHDELVSRVDRLEARSTVLDVAENIRELNALAERIARLEAGVEAGPRAPGVWTTGNAQACGEDDDSRA